MSIDTETWRTVCGMDAVPTERAVAALLPEAQVVLVRTANDDLYCVGHHDPYSGANVIARGIVGSARVAGDWVPTIASPMHKQVFDLRDGHCLSDPAVTLGAWHVRCTDGTVQIGACVIEATGRADD